jgi:SRSO17 transposase
MKPYDHTIPQESKTTIMQVVQWGQELQRLHARIVSRFARPEPAQRALAYLQALLSETPRKNGWQIAEHAREARPDGMQRFLASAVWDADGVRDDLRTYILQHLGDPQAVIVIDETCFLKKGNKSAGVARQYCGLTQRLENCQVGVFLSYVSAGGHSLLDRELYIPQHWFDTPSRGLQAGIPGTARFQTKCELARLMLERIWQAHIPIRWVVADTVYGNNEDLRHWLEEHDYHYVLAVACDEAIEVLTQSVRQRMTVAEAATRLLSEHDWQRLSMGEGTKGPRCFDWACLPILHRGAGRSAPLAAHSPQSDRSDRQAVLPGLRTRGDDASRDGESHWKALEYRRGF